MLEYDITLTGVVAHMKIMTLGRRNDPSDDPVQMMVDFGRALPGRIARLASLVGIGKSSSTSASGGGEKGDGGGNSPR